MIGLVVYPFPKESLPNFCLQYEDEDHDKVVLASDSDLAAAVDHARMAGLKVYIYLLISC